MSCPCGAAHPDDCPTLGELGAPPWDKLHKAMWCLLHPIQCKDNVITRPIHTASELVALAAVVFVWWRLTER